MQRQITYTEDDLAELFHVRKRKIQEWRKHGLLQGIKVSQGYIYHDNEITDFFDDFRGKNIANIEAIKKAT